MSDLMFDDLAPRYVNITLGKGNAPTHRLYEATAEAARQFRNAQIRGATINNKEESTKIGDIGDSESVLVASCLFEISGRPVELATVRSWPYAVVKKMYEQVREMSPALEEKETEESIQKQIDKLVKKLADLKRPADPNSLSAGTAISA